MPVNTKVTGIVDPVTLEVVQNDTVLLSLFLVKVTDDFVVWGLG